MTTTLITGATRGLGRETARRLTEAGHDVWVGARDPDAGRAVAADLGARWVQLDVTDDESVRAGYDPVVYPASKAALNMVTVKLARALPAARVNAVNPGYTATDFNEHQGTLTVQQGAEAIVRAALFGPDGPTGTFLEEAGEVAW
jgi:NAD(P)-dependent dehydrogenase (short-subunit alcohol dehydrogenase family)